MPTAAQVAKLLRPTTLEDVCREERIFRLGKAKA